MNPSKSPRMIDFAAAMAYPQPSTSASRASSSSDVLADIKDKALLYIQPMQIEKKTADIFYNTSLITFEDLPEDIIFNIKKVLKIENYHYIVLDNNCTIKKCIEPATKY